jgi:hypothetical protein
MKKILTVYSLVLIALMMAIASGCNNASYEPADKVQTDSAAPAVTGGQANDTAKISDVKKPAPPPPPDNAQTKQHDMDEIKTNPVTRHDVVIHRIDTAVIKNVPGTDTATKNRDSVKNNVPVIDISKLNNEGVVVWELPEKMRTFIESSVKVRIATIANEMVAKAGIDTTRKNSGSEKIDISEKMKVTLEAGKDSDFIIVAKDIIHTIPGKKYAEWFWTVTPLKPGTRYLILKVSQVTVVNGKEIPAEENSVLSKEFTVKVTAAYVASTVWNFIKSNWAIITAIITFFAGLLVRNKIKGAKDQAP